jgi:hypothetical protein
MTFSTVVVSSMGTCTVKVGPLPAPNQNQKKEKKQKKKKINIRPPGCTQTSMLRDDMATFATCSSDFLGFAVLKDKFFSNL